MRMLLKVSLLVVGAAGFLAAQHGGGGHGGGGGFHGGGGGGGFHSSAPAARSSGYYRSNSAVVPPPSYSGHLTLSTPTAQFRYGNGGITGSRSYFGRPPIRGPIRRPYYGFGLYPFLPFGYYDNDFYDPYYDSGPGVPYAYPDQEQYAPQYEQPPDPYYGAYPPIPYAPYPDPQQQQPPPGDPPSTPITLVLKSGQKLEVQNYAIMDGVFWDFTKPNSKKILIANIDIPASAKATDAAGGAFPEEFFATNPR